MARWLSLPLVLLSACAARERDCTNGEDDDNDGWTDCRDQDCAGSCREHCGNFLDDDGDGQVDCVDSDCASSCPAAIGGDEDCRNGSDDDGDWLLDCGDPDCELLCDTDADTFVGADFGGDDCDDDDADVYPGAPELPYDGVDQDCDALTPDDDLDGDGFLRAEDCDDTRAASFPGASETCGDRVVNDCDAPGQQFDRDDCFGERPLSTADAVLLGTSVDDWTAYTVASAGDMDEDGTDDVLVGAYGVGGDASGAVYLVSGPVQGTFDLAQATIKWVAESEDDWAGFALAAGRDLTGDGHPDAAIGARYDDATGNNGGAVYVVRGQGSGTIDLFEAAAKVYAEDEYDSTGYAVAIPGDVGDDGQDDLLIGSPEAAANGLASGLVHLVHGPVMGDVQLSVAGYRVVGERAGDNLGCAVAGPGDLDGDGLADLLVSACSSDRNAVDAGAAYQFSTHLDEDRSATDADGAIVGQGPNDQMGYALAGGDLNNDGRADVIVAAPYHDPGLTDAGAVYVSNGPAQGEQMNQPTAKLSGRAEGDHAGISVAVVGDLDGDGYDDLAVGAPGSDTAGEDAGEAYVVFGPLLGQMLLEDADIRFIGQNAFDFAGQSVSSAGDFDDDGLFDLVLGAPFHDGLAPSSGAAYVFTFHW